MKYLLVQKTEVDPSIGNDGEPHVFEHLYSDFAEMITDLAAGEDNHWTYQVLCLTFDGDKVVSMQDVTENVANCVAAASWTVAKMDLPVHPLALGAIDQSVAELVADRAEINHIQERYLGCRMPITAVERIEELGGAI